MIENQLRKILFERDMSIRELAEKTGVAYSTVYNFAHKKQQSAHYGLLDKICETLQIQPGDMLVWRPTLITRLTLQTAAGETIIDKSFDDQAAE